MRNRNKNENESVVRALVRSTFALSLVCAFIVPTPTWSIDLLVGTSQNSTFNYQVGRSLCRLVNSRAGDRGCEVLPAEEGLHSSDQIHTLTNVQNGALDLGIVDSALQYDAINRSGQLEYFDIGTDNIRGLFSLNGIPFTVIVRDQPGVKTFSDLKGGKINVGNPGSPQRAIMDNLMRINGWGRNDFQLMEELPASQSQDTLALCFGTVDAVIRFDAHPNANTRHMVELCGAHLIDVTGSTVDRLIGDNPYYSMLSIPAGLYDSNPRPIETFGLTETVIATADLDEETIYALVKLVFENVERLQTLPAFKELNPDQMHTVGMSVPLHPGALRYYRERGWRP